MTITGGRLLSCGSAALLVASPVAVPTLGPAPAAAQTTTNTCSDGQRRWLDVRNLSRDSVVYLKVRDSYSNDEWSEDRLGQTAIPSGQYIYVLMPSGDCQCSADIQVTYGANNGQEPAVEEYYAVNYCTSGSSLNPLLIVGN